MVETETAVDVPLDPGAKGLDPTASRTIDAALATGQRKDVNLGGDTLL